MQILRLRFAPPQDDTFHGEWTQGGYTFSGIALAYLAELTASEAEKAS
jgi:hypothetical protein